jgi:uncharacterized protein (DUF2147 family)
VVVVVGVAGFAALGTGAVVVGVAGAVAADEVAAVDAAGALAGVWGATTGLVVVAAVCGAL